MAHDVVDPNDILKDCYLITCYGTIINYDLEAGTFTHEDVNTNFQSCHQKEFSKRYMKIVRNLRLSSNGLSNRCSYEKPEFVKESIEILSHERTKFVNLVYSDTFLKTLFTPQTLQWQTAAAGSEMLFLAVTEEELAEYARFLRSMHRHRLTGALRCPRLRSEFEFSIGDHKDRIERIIDGSFFAEENHDRANDRNHSASRTLKFIDITSEHRAESVFIELEDGEAAESMTITPPLMLPGGSAYFYARYFQNQIPPAGRSIERLTFYRKTNCLISMERLSEGAIFSSEGVYQGFGFLNDICPRPAWLHKDGTRSIFWPDFALREAEPLGKVVVFYNGNLHNLYHWLIEGILPLALMMHDLPAGFSLLLPDVIRQQFPIDHLKILAAAGLDKLPVVWSSASAVHATEVLFCNNMESIERIPTRLAREWSRTLDRRNRDFTVCRRRIFVVRRGARSFHNEGELFAILVQWQFEAVFLEDLSPSDQVSLFQDADFIIAAHGAGLSNIIYCRPGTRLLELMPDTETRPFFWLLAEKFGLISAMLHCSVIENSYEDNRFNWQIRVDVTKLTALYQMLLYK